MNCIMCNKEFDDMTSTLCPECQESHKAMNWGDLLRRFTKTERKEETSNPTVDDILTKSGYRGFNSLTEKEKEILFNYRDRMMRNRGVI